MAVCNDTTTPIFARLRVYWAERPLHISIANGNGGLCTIDALQSLPLHPAYRATIEHVSAAAGCNFIHYHRHPYTSGAPYVAYGVPVTFPYSSAGAQQQHPQQPFHFPPRPSQRHSMPVQQQQHAMPVQLAQQNGCWAGGDGKTQNFHGEKRAPEGGTLKSALSSPKDHQQPSWLSSSEKEAICSRVKKAAETIQQHKQQQILSSQENSDQEKGENLSVFSADIHIKNDSNPREETANHDGATSISQQKGSRSSSSSLPSKTAVVDSSGDKIPTPEISEETNILADMGSEATSSDCSNDHPQNEKESECNALARLEDRDEDGAAAVSEEESDIQSNASSLSIHLGEV